MSNDNNGCLDPDYYDVEFREQNPEVYGNDELMQSYRGSSRRGQQPRQGRTYRPSDSAKSRSQKAAQFHSEYEQWRRNHPDKIAFFRSQSGSNSNDEFIWPRIIIALIIWPIIIFALIQSCE